MKKMYLNDLTNKELDDLIERLEKLQSVRELLREEAESTKETESPKYVITINDKDE